MLSVYGGSALHASMHPQPRIRARTAPPNRCSLASIIPPVSGAQLNTPISRNVNRSSPARVKFFSLHVHCFREFFEIPPSNWSGRMTMNRVSVTCTYAKQETGRGDASRRFHYIHTGSLRVFVIHFV